MALICFSLTCYRFFCEDFPLILCRAKMLIQMPEAADYQHNVSPDGYEITEKFIALAPCICVAVGEKRRKDECVYMLAQRNQQEKRVSCDNGGSVIKNPLPVLPSSAGDGDGSTTLLIIEYLLVFQTKHTHTHTHLDSSQKSSLNSTIM